MVRRNIRPPPPREYGSLREACDANDWRDGLFINTSLAMGVNNLRSELAQSLKFAFDAGAGLVLPNIQLRDNSTLFAWRSDNDTFIHTDPSYYFDIDHLRTDLATACPQMKLKDTWDHTGVAAVARDVPRGWWERRFGKGEYRQHADGLLREHNIHSFGPNNIAIVEETLLPYAVFNYRTEQASLSTSFFDMLHWAPRLRNLGKSMATHPYLAGTFAGVHLRVEKDTFWDWPSFQEQVDAYSPFIHNMDTDTIFLACGDSTWKDKFRAIFHQYRVYDKWDLLATGPSGDAEAAARLGFDELGVLDYIVMLKATQVFGIGRSSFAYLLGIDRRMDRDTHFSDTLYSELHEGASLWGDHQTKLLPPILAEYYAWFP